MDDVVDLISVDGGCIKVKPHIARQSQVIKDALEVLGLRPVLVPGVNERNLRKVINWCSREHKSPEGRDGDIEEGEFFIGDNENSLFDILLAANYLDIPPLLRWLCRFIARKVETSLPTTLSMYLNMQPYLGSHMGFWHLPTELRYMIYDELGLSADSLLTFFEAAKDGPVEQDYSEWLGQKVLAVHSPDITILEQMLPEADIALCQAYSATFRCKLEADLPAMKNDYTIFSDPRTKWRITNRVGGIYPKLPFAQVKVANVGRTGPSEDQFYAFVKLRELDTVSRYWPFAVPAAGVTCITYQGEPRHLQAIKKYFKPMKLQQGSRMETFKTEEILALLQSVVRDGERPAQKCALKFLIGFLQWQNDPWARRGTSNRFEAGLQVSDRAAIEALQANLRRSVADEVTVPKKRKVAPTSRKERQEKREESKRQFEQRQRRWNKV